MIDQSLINHIEAVIEDSQGSAVDISTGKLAELLGGYKSLIEQNAELHKKLAKLTYAVLEKEGVFVVNDGADDKCKHQSTEALYTHVECNTCHHIKTDGGWGVASRKWFENLEQAKFYERNGFIPK